MGRSKQTSTGRAGEYLVASLLESNGIEVYRVDGDFDLIANLDGRLIRIEVKSSTKIRATHGTYVFHPVRKTDFDAYILVVIPLGLMRIFWGNKAVYGSQITLRPEEFTKEKQEQDLRRLWREFGFGDGGRL